MKIKCWLCCKMHECEMNVLSLQLTEFMSYTRFDSVMT